MLEIKKKKQVSTLGREFSIGNVARKGQKSYYLPGFDSLIAVNCAKHVTCIQRGQWSTRNAKGN
jgi:hypothetical protein